MCASLMWFGGSLLGRLGGKIVSAYKNALITAIPHLRQYAHSVICAPNEADELVREALLRTLAQIKQREEETSHRREVFANLQALLEDRRVKSVRFKTLAESAGGSDNDARANSLSGEDTLIAALQALPFDQRCCLLLVTMGEFSYDDIATIMASSVGSVRAKLTQARENLTPAPDHIRIESIDQPMARQDRSAGIERVFGQL